MELVEGKTLDAWLAETKRSWRAILTVFVQVGHGLAAAHHKDLGHRDVKPQNLMVTKAGNAKVIDFGLVHTACERARSG